MFRAQHGNIEVISEDRFPDSIGLLYSSFTQFLGFKVNSDEYKVMGLAPYGDLNSEETGRFIDLIKSNLVNIEEDGNINLNLAYFRFHYSDMMIDVEKWETLFGIKSRSEGNKITLSHKNMALAIQSVTQDILQKIILYAAKDNRDGNLCLSGGVALNCAVNGFLRTNDIYNNIFVPFAPGDCGCAIGAAMAYIMLTRRETNFSLTPYLGPEYSDSEIRKALQYTGFKYRKFEILEELCSEVARMIDEGSIVGWFQGRMEVGPRALGNRSIIADARKPKMKDEINSRIKFREAFRPFAPAVIKEYTSQFV